MPPSRTLAPFSPWCSKNSPKASDVLWAFLSRSPPLLIRRHRSQDQIYPSTVKVSRLKRSHWKKKKKELDQTVLAHESTLNLWEGAHTINLLLTLLWKYVWRKQPIVVWNVFKYKIMPFVWEKNFSNVRVQKSPVAFTSTLCAVCALASPLGALPRPL